MEHTHHTHPFHPPVEAPFEAFAQRGPFDRRRFNRDAPGGPPFGRGGRGGPFPRGRGGRGRVGRGQIRTALLALLEDQSMHGYEMIRQLDERSGGQWKPSPGAVYPTLAQLTDEDLVSVVEDGGKRIFSLTPQGRELVESLADEDRRPWEHDGGAHPAFELRGLVQALGMATRSVAMSGTPDQLERAKGVLEAARRSLYAILAEDPHADASAASND